MTDALTDAMIDTMIDTIEDLNGLLEALRDGAQPDYLFFWGHTPRDGAAGPGAECLSQWYAGAPFDLDGLTYATAEHYMMAAKARCFDDDDARARILAADTPGQAKKIGRQVRDYDDATWGAARVDAVVRGNIAKFGQHPDLGDFLRSTHPRVLVEASPRDRIWGIGMGARNERARDPFAWRGENLLGFALMRARAALRAQDASE